MIKNFKLSQLMILTILSMALFIISSCQTVKTSIKGVKKATDYETMNLKGPIKSLKVKKYQASKNTQTGEIIKRSLSRADAQNLSYVFNENGNITEKISYDIDDQIKSKWTYVYDDKKSQVIEKVYNNSEEEPKFRQIDHYDKNGNKTKHLGYTQGDDEPYKETLKYDKNGNILEEVHYVEGGPSKTQYKYDDQGNLIEKRQLMADKPMMKETYEYYEEGKLVASKQEEGRTTHASYIFEKRYKDGNETERKVFKDGEPDGRFIYKYNDNGYRVEYQKYDLNNNLVAAEKTEFGYDQKNNWIKKIPLDRKGIPRYLVERKIEYFEE